MVPHAAQHPSTLFQAIVDAILLQRRQRSLAGGNLLLYVFQNVGEFRIAAMSTSQRFALREMLPCPGWIFFTLESLAQLGQFFQALLTFVPFAFVFYSRDNRPQAVCQADVVRVAIKGFDQPITRLQQISRLGQGGLG